MVERPSARSATRLILAAGLAVWVADALIMWLGAAPLGHDEAQYALAAKDVLAGDEARWFYLSTGMNALAAVGNLLGGSEIAMRLPTFLFGLVFIVAAWRLAHTVFDDATAAWTVAVLAGARQTAKWSAELLSDMPATTFLLLGTMVIATELIRSRARPSASIRWRIVWAAPLFAAAFYLRFASCVPIAIVGVAAVGFGWRAILRRPWPLLATVVVLGGLLVPHMLSAIDLTGSPIGILLESKSVPGHSSFASGLVTYLTSNPFLFYGVLMPPVFVAGAAVVLRPSNRIWLFVWLIAVADIIALGLITEAQARYIMFGTTLLVMLGVDAIRDALANPLVAKQRVMLERVAGAAVIAAWLFVIPSLLRHVTTRPDAMAEILDAAAAIRADRGAHRCFVSGTHYTQLEWYTSCPAVMVNFTEAFARGDRTYLVLDGTPEQPDPAVFPGKKIQIREHPTVLRVDPP